MEGQKRGDEKESLGRKVCQAPGRRKQAGSGSADWPGAGGGGSSGFYLTGGMVRYQYWPGIGSAFLGTSMHTSTNYVLLFMPVHITLFCCCF